jgi:hypothetical protein
MSGDSLTPTVAAARSSRLLHTNAVPGNRLYLRSNSFCISWYGRKSSSSARLIRRHCLIVNLLSPPTTCTKIRVVIFDIRRDCTVFSIREIPVPNLGRDTAYPENCRGILQSLQASPDIKLLVHISFPPCPLHFTILPPSYHSTLHNHTHWQQSEMNYKIKWERYVNREWTTVIYVKWNEVKWVTLKFLGTKVPCTLGWPYTEGT